MDLPKNYRFVYPPTIRFSQLFQRPQQLMLALARLGYETYFVDILPHKDPRMDLPENFHLVQNMKDVPKEHVVFWATQGISFPQFMHLFTRPIRVFDFVDLNKGYEKVLRHQILMGLENADLVFAVSEACRDEAIKHKGSATLMPNGVDFDHFATSFPSSVASLKDRPIIGFYGAVYPWVDTELIIEVARKRPQYQFLIVGPQYGEPLKHAPENVITVGHTPYMSLPSLMAPVDAFILPFKVDAMTNASDPIKLWEYLATGKPVVSTPIRAANKQWPVVQVADGADRFARELDHAVAENEWAPIRWIRRHVARTNSWDVRAQEIVRVLGEWLERSDR